MRITFGCSAVFTCSKTAMLEKISDFMFSMDTSAQHENIIMEETEDSVSARLFFVETPVVFTVKGNLLSVVADSTMTGPGYHASMINMLDYMAETFQLSWDEESIFDESGYWQHRDFKRLQKYMTDWLLSYAKSLTDDPDLKTPVRTNLIMPYAMLPSGREYFACHILGYMNKDFFTYIQEFEEPDLFSRSFFIWWNMELDAEFYLKCALSLMWCRLNWLPPVLEHEMLDITNVLLELEIAWQMDKSLQLPVPEWIELAKLTADQELADELISRFPTEINQPPSKGYRRYDIIHSLGDGQWQIKLPGKMHISNDEDGSLLFWDHDERNIRITVTAGRDKNGTPVPGLELLSSVMSGLRITPHLLPGHINVPAFISHSEVQEGAKSIYKSTLFAAVDGSMAIVSIYYASPEEKTWAISICNSLTLGPRK